MGFITTALIVGAGAAAMGVAGARKDAKRQQAAMARQETMARESNRVDQTRPDGGADIVLGTDEDKGGARKATTSRKAKPTAAVNPLLNTPLGRPFANFFNREPGDR